MLGFAPLSSLPLSALPENSLTCAVECDTIVEAALADPLVDLLTAAGEGRARLVIAVEITAVPIGA